MSTDRQVRILVFGKPAARTTPAALALDPDEFEVAVEGQISTICEAIGAFRPDLVVVDAISMKSSGIRFVQRIRQVDKGLPLLVVCDDRGAYDGRLRKDEIVAAPLTARKLTNRIRRLLPNGTDGELTVGPMRLDPSRRCVHCFGRSTLLTPKAFAMLMLLVMNSGKLVSRERLMKLVWDTDYTGDTRTLDVHVSWLRRAIEKDPSHPQLLKTIRGVGFRLDVS